MQRPDEDKFHELSFYTLSHPNQKYFIHQHVVDAYFAQTANEHSKSIGITFALVGLYLYLEKGFTGKEVQLAHMQLAKNKRVWPIIKLPVERGNIRVGKVIEAMAGDERDKMIRLWCLSVWESYCESHSAVTHLLERELGIQI